MVVLLVRATTLFSFSLFIFCVIKDARACIVGMSASHTRNHIVRAALESTAYQTRE